MIDEYISRLERLFVTNVDTLYEVKTRGRARASNEDLYPLDIFYSSTVLTEVNPSTKKRKNMNFLEDPIAIKAKELRDAETIDGEVDRADREEEAIRSARTFEKNYIYDLTADTDELGTLRDFLMRNMRARTTAARLKRDEVNEAGDVNRNVFYISPSFLIDGVYPLVDGLYKRGLVCSLRDTHVRWLPEPTTPHVWNSVDAGESFIASIFGPTRTSSISEDYLQRLFLSPGFRLRETHKLNPRGALLASVALLCPDDDPILTINDFDTTTLRGLVKNVLDGTLYAGMAFVALRGPFTLRLDGLSGDDNDLIAYCTRLLDCSYMAICLTLLGIKPCRTDRIPEDAFAETTNGFVTVKSAVGEAMYDAQDGSWLFKDKQGFVAAKSFEGLLRYIYRRGGTTTE